MENKEDDYFYVSLARVNIVDFENETVLSGTSLIDSSIDDNSLFPIIRKKYFEKRFSVCDIIVFKDVSPTQKYSMVVSLDKVFKTGVCERVEFVVFDCFLKIGTNFSIVSCPSQFVSNVGHVIWIFEK